SHFFKSGSPSGLSDLNLTNSPYKSKFFGHRSNPIVFSITNKKSTLLGGFLFVAEREGFEPSERY
ncbi:MAG: hypothetical protein J6S23_06720, partial [Clostridia bacterium]|nr:hypothetical protein [Clostridia bacterium]